MPNMFVEPKSVTHDTSCQICGATNGVFYQISYSFGIYACDTHKKEATLGLKNWMHTNGVVHWRNATSDPLFNNAEDLIHANILVRRTSGTIENNWMLMKPSLWNSANVKRSRTCGKWYMTAIQDYTDNERAILVEDLKLSLAEENHGLVDAFIARLESGFYKEELDAATKDVE